MFLLKANGDGRVLENLHNVKSVGHRDGRISVNRLISIHNLPPDEADARFDDIVEALASGKVNVYDATAPIGAWKTNARAS